MPRGALATFNLTHMLLSARRTAKLNVILDMPLWCASLDTLDLDLVVGCAEPQSSFTDICLQTRMSHSDPPRTYGVAGFEHSECETTMASAGQPCR